MLQIVAEHADVGLQVGLRSLAAGERRLGARHERVGDRLHALGGLRVPQRQPARVLLLLLLQL